MTRGSLVSRTGTHPAINQMRRPSHPHCHTTLCPPSLDVIYPWWTPPMAMLYTPRHRWISSRGTYTHPTPMGCTTPRRAMGHTCRPRTGRMPPTSCLPLTACLLTTSCPLCIHRPTPARRILAWSGLPSSSSSQTRLLPSVRRHRPPPIFPSLLALKRGARRRLLPAGRNIRRRPLTRRRIPVRSAGVVNDPVWKTRTTNWTRRLRLRSLPRRLPGGWSLPIAHWLFSHRYSCSATAHRACRTCKTSKVVTVFLLCALTNSLRRRSASIQTMEKGARSVYSLANNASSISVSRPSRQSSWFLSLFLHKAHSIQHEARLLLFTAQREGYHH
jgi:hypothetical protein